MRERLSRRFVLSGLLAGAAGMGRAEGPLTSVRPPSRGAPVEPPSANDLVDAARLGGAVGFVAVDAETGEVLDALNPELRLPPASVAKSATSYYALSRLGAEYRFVTRLVATGPVVDGRIEGDLILRGAGDPQFDTDMLGDMAARLKARGVREVAGAFRVDAGALPALPFIDPEQPDQVGYNPALGGLDLNYNRVHFEWARGPMATTSRWRRGPGDTARRCRPRGSRSSTARCRSIPMRIGAASTAGRWRRARLARAARAGCRCGGRRTMPPTCS